MDAARALAKAERGRPLRAAPEEQQRLLDLQAVDLRLDQLAHRRRTLPEEGELAALDRRAGGLRDLLVGAQTERSDLERQRVKADADVDQVRARARRDQERLDSGRVGSPKELENLQSEIASLARRQSDLEDVELEILQRMEDVDARVSDLQAQADSLSADRDDLAARLQSRVAELERDTAAGREERARIAAAVEPALLTLYDKVREQQGGIAAAELRQKRCGGCRMELNSAELAEVRAAPADDVLRHEECRRILVRTAESGL